MHRRGDSERDGRAILAQRVVEGACAQCVNGVDQGSIHPLHVRSRQHHVAVASGEAIFGPAIARRLMTFFTQRAAPPAPFPDLTEREREILTLIAQGWSNTEIADHFVITLKTVRNHVSNIFNRLEVADRAQAM